MMINRRHFFVAGAAASVLPHAWAQQEPRAQFKPYVQVKPFPGEHRNVRVWFSPSCPFSRDYMPFFKNLAATLPEAKRLVYSPVVNRGDGLGYALAFAAVQQAYPEYVPNFIEASFIGVQDHKLQLSDWAALDRIGQAARLPRKLTETLLSVEATAKSQVNQYTTMQSHMKITNTPSVAVVGTYIVTPEFTSGDAEQFSRLVNSLVSMTL